MIMAIVERNRILRPSTRLASFYIVIKLIQKKFRDWMN